MLGWMAWTMPTAIFFAIIVTILLAMAGAEFIWPTQARKGLLHITTTRGERLFIGMLACGWVNILWIASTDASQWIALTVGVLLAILILARG